MMISRVLLVFGVIFLTGCQSGYEKFYNDESAYILDFLEPFDPSLPAQIYQSSGDFGADELHMFENGYVRIGSASFNGRLENESALLEQAAAVGAQAVVVSQEFSDRITSSIPITTTSPVTTYSSGSVSSYGYGGSSYGTYSGTSTTYVPKTTYVQIAVDRYDQSALFFAERKPSCLGFLVGDISTTERQKIGTNAGVKIAVVRKGAPVYVADVVPGDILLEIDGKRIDIDSLTSMKIPSNKMITITLFRNGSVVEKTLITGNCLL